MKHWMIGFIGIFLIACSDEAIVPIESDTSCESDLDCGDNESCQTAQESCHMECAPIPTACSLDLMVWCGCNGLLYKGSGTKECMKTAVDHTGPCDGTTLTNFGSVCQGSGCCSSDQDCGEGWSCNQGICLISVY